MKTFIYLLWGLLSVSLAAAALGLFVLEPSLVRGFVLLLLAYYVFCFFQLIRTAFLPWGLLGPRRRCGYWICLLLLPLALWPMTLAYDIWKAGGYRVDTSGEGVRTSVLIFRQVLVWLQELVGYVGPMLVLVAMGLGMALLLLRLSRSQVVR